MASSKHVLSFRLYCSDCKNMLQVATTQLYHDSKWASLFCDTCSRSSTAKKWLCGCMQPWANCKHHASIGFACKSYKRAQPDASVAPHRDQPPRARTYVLPLKAQQLVAPNRRNIAVHRMQSASEKPAPCLVVQLPIPRWDGSDRRALKVSIFPAPASSSSPVRTVPSRYG